MTIRPASTLMLLRSGTGGLEVLMTERAPQLFGGGWWVFPGGAVDDADRSDENRDLIAGVDDDIAPWVGAALRETAEEVGLFLTTGEQRAENEPREDAYGYLRRSGTQFDGAAVEYVSNWVTPEGVEKRFDTRFYVAAWPGGDEAVPDGVEVVRCQWVNPGDMLARDREDFPLIFPTIKHLEMLAEFEIPQGVLDHARSIDVVQVAPHP